MRVGLFLLVALVSLTLPCLELPECAGMYEDASTDFIVVPFRTEGRVCTARVRAARFATAPLRRGAVSMVLPIPFTSAPIPPMASVLERVSVQKK